MTNPAARKKGYYQSSPDDNYTAPSVSSVLKPVEGIVCFHHRAEWDIKMKIGNEIHAFAEQWANGKGVDCPPEYVGYMDALEALWKAFKLRPVMWERTVIYSHESLAYGGTFDLIADLWVNGRWARYLLDLKTGRLREEVVSQLAAYRHATHLGVYDSFGKLESLEPMVEVDACGVLHVQDDGTFALIPIEAGPVQHEAFMHLRRFFAIKPTKKSLGKPLKFDMEAVA